MRASELERLRVDKLTISGSLFVHAAVDLGLHYVLLPERTLSISNNTQSHFIKGTSLPCNNMVAAEISRNKYLSRKIFKSANLPVPRTITMRLYSQWQKAITSRLKFPLVVKPINASHANGATMNIQDEASLRKAVYRAFKFMKKKGKTDRVLVEEFYEGQDIRLLVVGEKVVSVLLRKPAYVIGNGTDNIRQLIHTFNQEWQSTIPYDYPLCPMPIDTEVYRYLKTEHRSLRHIPQNSEEVQLRWNGNVSTGGRPFDITSEVHPDIKEVAIQATKALKLEIAGIDILAKDYTSNDTSINNIVLLEANDAPGIDMHQFPYEGKGQPIGRYILQHIFKIKESEKPNYNSISALINNPTNNGAMQNNQ